MADEEKKTSKRRVVKNPETFRERAVKAAEEGDKPRKSHRVRSGAAKVTRPVTTPIGKSFAKVGKSKGFKPFRKPLRIVGKVLLPTYIRDSWRELKQVTWPNWQQSRQLTFAVLIFAAIFGAIVAAVDYGLDKLFRQVLLK